MKVKLFPKPSIGLGFLARYPNGSQVKLFNALDLRSLSMIVRANGANGLLLPFLRNSVLDLSCHELFKFF